MRPVILLILLLLLAISCGGGEDSESSSSGGFDSGVPAIDPIVAETTPSGLKSSFVGLRLQKNNQVSMLDTPVTDPASLITWLTTYVTSTCDTCAASLYYRYWTKVVDEEIAQLEQRFSTVPDCVTATPTEVNFPNPMGDGTIDIHLSCNDSGDGSSSNPQGVDSMDRFFGVNNGTVYLLQRIVYSNGSKRAFIAEASSEGNDVKIWDISKGTDTGTDLVVRIFADKTTDEFTYFLASENPTYTNGVTHFFARTLGGNAFISTQTAENPASSTMGIPQDIFSTTTVCSTSDDITSETGDCDAINAQPTGFAIGADETADSLRQTDTTGIADLQYNTDLDAIINEDLTAIPDVRDSLSE